MNISAEESKRRSELAKKLHEGGKFGGVQKGAGRPKTKRATEAVAEAAKEDAHKIVKKLRGLMNSNSDAIALKALLAYLDIESKESDRQIKEQQRQYENLSRDKLLEMIGERFEQLRAEGVDIEGILFEKATRGAGRERVEKPLEGNGRALPSGEEG